MTRYGQDYYGQDPGNAFVYYGLTFPPQNTPTSVVVPQYTVDPMLAQSIDYSHILVTWTQPATAGWSDFRLLSNRYGFPVDENDGVLLLDSGGSAWPGSSYLDENVIPGTYQHYGVYLLVNPVELVGVPPVLNQTQASWANGQDSDFLYASTGSANLTNNIPVGAPNPYGIAYVAPAGGSGTCAFPFYAPVIIQPSTEYTVSAWVYSPTGTVYLGMDWEIGSDSLVSSNVNEFSIPLNTWTQVSSVVTSPATGATYGSAVFYASSSANQPAYTMYVTGITIQGGSTNTISARQAEGQWVRAGLAACLAPTSYDSSQFLIDNIPEFFLASEPDGDITTDAVGNSFFQQYLSIIGWSIDYLKTALAVAENVNNPNIIPINDLYNLAQTVGFPFEPEISAGVIRMGIQNVAQLVQQRGTPEGIAAYIVSLAGMAVDLQVGYNLMLETDQSSFTDPIFSPWNTTTAYYEGEFVIYYGYIYTSISGDNLNNAPSGNDTNNDYWDVVYYNTAIDSMSSYLGLTPEQIVLTATGTASPNFNSFGVYQVVSGGTVSDIQVYNPLNGVTTDTTLTSGTFFIPAGGSITVYYTVAPTTFTTETCTLLNSDTGWLNTWEPRWTVSDNEFPGYGEYDSALIEIIGILDRSTAGAYLKKGLAITNLSGQTSSISLRSVSRNLNDIQVGNVEPDTAQIINDGIPVPFTLPSQLWSATTTYQSGEIITYQGLPFQALKASTNIAPSSDYSASNEWQPLGYDSRIQLMTSGYSSGDIGGTSLQFNMQPYVSFYDQYGLSIADLPARSISTQTNDADMCATTNQAFATTSGTVLTASAVGVTTIDDVTVTTIGQTVLLTAQTSGLQNGYYTVTTVGTTTAKTVLTRYSGFLAVQYPYSYCYVQGGSANIGQTFYCTNTSTPTLGTTALTFNTTAPAGIFYPDLLVFDSFAKPSDWGNDVTAHSPEVGLSNGTQFTYTAEANNFLINAYNNGVITPSNPNTQCLVTTNYGQANAMLGITIVTTPLTTGFVQGLACRVASTTSYIRIDQNAIVEHNGTAYTVLATHSVAAGDGDRLTAILDGTVITVYVNGTEVSSATSSFNDTATLFGYIYETQATISGKVQPKPTRGTPRRVRRSIRAVTNHTAGAFIWHIKVYGPTQPRATVPTPRRAHSRAFTRFIPVKGTNHTGGRVQSRATLASQRSLVQHHRAFVHFRPVVTENREIGTDRPTGSAMLPRRHSSRAFVRHTPNVTANHAYGSVQKHATLPAQRSKTQHHRGIPTGAGHFGNDNRVEGKTERRGFVAQRSAVQHHRAVTKNTFVAAEDKGPGRYGPAGMIQHSGFVAQRSKTQRHRGMVGNQFLNADVEETPTTNLMSGHVQPRATVPVSRRKTSRAKVGNTTASAGEPGIQQRGKSPAMQPSAARPVQRTLAQRHRGVIKGVVNYEIGPEQPRGPSGHTQPRPVAVAQRMKIQRSRAHVTMHKVITQNKAGSGKTQPRQTLAIQRSARQRTRAHHHLPPVISVKKSG